MRPSLQACLRNIAAPDVEPSEPVDGGHAMCLIGYQDDAGAPDGGYFILRNSWGQGWGAQCPFGAGNGTIPYQYIANDCWEAVTTAVPKKRHFWDDWFFTSESEDQGGPGSERPKLVIDTGGKYDIIIR
jgi:C1A family cysteine protease